MSHDMLRYIARAGQRAAEEVRALSPEDLAKRNALRKTLGLPPLNDIDAARNAETAAHEEWIKAERMYGRSTRW